MKPIVYALCFLVLLATVLLVVNYKDFYPGDDNIRNEVTIHNTSLNGAVEKEFVTETTRRIEILPDEIKPVAKSDVEPEIYEIKHVSEIKPITETKLDEIKMMAETKPATDNRAEPNILADIKPEETPLPAAIPVVTAEEAEKLNEEAKSFALDEKEKEEPFYRLYAGAKNELISFEGTIKAASLVPNPQTNDYDNCLYALFVEVDSVLSDTPASDSVSYEVVINVPIMKNKRILEKNRFRPGNKINCLCVDYDEMPQAIREIQVSDDIQSFEHQQYYAIKLKGVTEFQTNGKKNFAKRESTVLPIQSLPREGKAIALRKERIQNELTHIEDELKKHGGSFNAWKEEYESIADKYNILKQEEFKEWINNSFFAANGNETSYKTKEYIDSILPYKKYLEANNIDLIVLRIPGKGDFSARVLASDEFQENPAWIEHYYECLKNDIEIVDPMRLMWEHRFDLPLFYYFNDSNERHPFEGTYYYSSIAIADVLKRYDYKREDEGISLLRVSRNVNQPRFFYPEGNADYPSSEHVQFNQVLFHEKPLVDLSQNTGSPFLFLGNCFFGRYIIKDLALPLYVAYQLQAIPDFIYKEGVTTGLVRHLFSSQGLLTNRKAVILIGMPDTWNACSSFPRYLLSEDVKISLEETIQLDSEKIKIREDGCSFGKRKEGGFWVEPEECKTVSFMLDIPHLQEKTTCMLRFKWLTTGINLPTINIYNAKDNSIIEYGAQPEKGQNTFCDFFIPLTESEETTIKIQLRVGSRKHVLDNIELWYY